MVWSSEDLEEEHQVHCSQDSFRLEFPARTGNSAHRYHDLRIPCREATRLISTAQDIKPDNILLNFGQEGTTVVEAKLADCGKPGKLVDPFAMHGS